MPATSTLVGSWPMCNNTAAVGRVIVQPVVEVTGGGVILAAAPLYITLDANGQISQTVVNTTNLPGLQYLVTELIGNAAPLSYVITPTAGTIDLSSAPRGVSGQVVPNPLYLLAAQAGAASGLATLGSDGILTAAQRPPGGGGFTPVISPLKLTSGAVTPPNTAGTWQRLFQTGGVVPFENPVAASVGDWCESSYSFVRQDSTGTFYDLGVVVGSGIVRFLSAPDPAHPETPAAEGDPALYQGGGGFSPVGSGRPRGFTVTANDLDTGRVRFALATRSNNTGQVLATTTYPFDWLSRNTGPHA